MRGRLVQLFCFLIAAATAGAASPLPAPSARPVRPAPPPASAIGASDPLRTGFRFATAIEADPNDQAKAQEEIVSDLIALGRLEDAGRWADTIKGWRRGTASADVGRAWALAGREARAREYVDKADRVRGVTSDWGGPRIAAHMARALALMGDAGRSESLVEDLARADPAQYSGRGAAAIAAGLAKGGDFEAAMARLEALDAERDFEVVWWRTTGYLDLARLSKITPAQRQKSIDAARRSADGIAGWKRGEALVDIGREQLERGGMPVAARESLAAAEAIIAPLPATLPPKARLMSDLAKGWAGAGERPRARGLLKRAESESSAAATIDRPGGLAWIAGAAWAIGDRASAGELFDRALSEAGRLVNARPRALAVVEICRSLGREQVDVEPGVRARLDALYAGLRDPW